MKDENYFKKEAIRIRVILNIFQKQIVWSEKGEDKIDRTTLSNWKQGRTKPNSKKLQIFLKKIDMNLGDFKSPENNIFAKAVSICAMKLDKQQKYNINQIISLINSESNGKDINNKSNQPNFFLIDRIKQLGEEKMNEYLNIYGGYYFAYMYWIKLNRNNKELQKEIKIVKFLLNINTIDAYSGAMNVRITNGYHLEYIKTKQHNDCWSHSGIVIPSGINLYLIFERKITEHTQKNIDFIVVNDSGPCKQLFGLFTGSSTEEPDRWNKGIPTSVRILLEKCEDKLTDDEMFKQLGYFDREQLKELTDDDIKKLENDTSEFSVLKAYSK